jgi:hypothetical protein
MMVSLMSSVVTLKLELFIATRVRDWAVYKVMLLETRFACCRDRALVAAEDGQCVRLRVVVKEFLSAVDARTFCAAEQFRFLL